MQKVIKIVWNIFSFSFPGKFQLVWLFSKWNSSSKWSQVLLQDSVSRREMLHQTVTLSGRPSLGSQRLIWTACRGNQSSPQIQNKLSHYHPAWNPLVVQAITQLMDKEWLKCNSGRILRSIYDQTWHFAASSCGSPTGLSMQYNLVMYGLRTGCPDQISAAPAMMTIYDKLSFTLPSALAIYHAIFWLKYTSTGTTT